MDLTNAIIAKSDQLNSADIIGGPQAFTVTEVRMGDSEQPVSIVLAACPESPLVYLHDGVARWEWELPDASDLADLITDAIDVDAAVERAACAYYERSYGPWSELPDRRKRATRERVRPIVLAALGRAS